MGIKNLQKLINTFIPDAVIPLNVNNLKNKKIGFDISIYMYQSIIAIRSKKAIMHDNIQVDHIISIILKILYFLKLKIIPILVFDGKPSDLKLNKLKERQDEKLNALKKLEEIDIDDSYYSKILKQTITITGKEMNEIEEIANLFGIPIIKAIEEADTELAYLSRNNLVDYIASDDMDLIPFGAKNIIRFFGKKNMFEINLNKLLRYGKIKYKELIDLCIILGCDYLPKLEKISYKKAWNLIKTKQSLEKIVNNNPKVPKEWLIDNKYKIVQEYFYNPIHSNININNLKLKNPNFDDLKDLLINKYHFSNLYVEKIIKLYYKYIS